MGTNTTSRLARPVSGDVMLRRLRAIRGMVPTGGTNATIFETRRTGRIKLAQEALEFAGYYLSEWEMVEHAFYQLTYLPDVHLYGMEHWPYWIKLRFITDCVTGPPLALTYFKDGVLQVYEGSYPRTYGTQTSDAEKMLFHFREDFPGVEPRWLPIFDDFMPVVHHA